VKPTNVENGAKLMKSFTRLYDYFLITSPLRRKCGFAREYGLPAKEYRKGCRPILPNWKNALNLQPLINGRVPQITNGKNQISP
jgi:hypothetical protein